MAQRCVVHTQVTLEALIKHYDQMYREKAHAYLIYMQGNDVNDAHYYADLVHDFETFPLWVPGINQDLEDGLEAARGHRADRSLIAG